jgi:hypothetical protein
VTHPHANPTGTRRVVPDPEVEPTLDVPAAGEFLGLGRAASYAAAARGELPVITIGRRKVVPTARLRAMLGLPAGGAEHAA